MAMRELATYHSDDGNTYTVLLPTWVYSLPAPSPGFSAYSSSNPPLPRYMKMRYITLKDPVSLRHRKLHCGSLTGAAWTTASASITLPNIDATSTVYTQDGWIGEKRRAI